MDQNVDDALVSGYEHIIGRLTLPDADDRHVLAAAIHGGAGIIVTVNPRDFLADMLTARNIEAQHPDTSYSSFRRSTSRVSRLRFYARLPTNVRRSSGTRLRSR